MSRPFFGLFRGARSRISYTEAESRVRSATSNDSSGPSEREMAEICQWSHNPQEFLQIMDTLRSRVTDQDNWRQVFKALLLIEYCLIHGNDGVRPYWVNYIEDLNRLQTLHFIDENGHDRTYVAQKAQNVAMLISDEAAFRHRRNRQALAYYNSAPETHHQETSSNASGPPSNSSSTIRPHNPLPSPPMVLPGANSNHFQRALEESILPNHPEDIDTQTVLMQGIQEASEHTQLQRALEESLRSRPRKNISSSSSAAIGRPPADRPSSHTVILPSPPLPSQPRLVLADIDSLLRTFIEQHGSMNVVGNQPSSAQENPEPVHSTDETPRSPENNSEAFEFLSSRSMFRSTEVGLSLSDYHSLYSPYANKGFIVLTSTKKAIIFNLATRGIREFKFVEAPNLEVCPCVISPDGNIIIRKLLSDGRVAAFNSRTKQHLSTLAPFWNVDRDDMSRIFWKDSTTAYIPIRRNSTIVQWSPRSEDTSSTQFLQPMEAVTEHEQLMFCTTSDEKHWVATGRTKEADGTQRGLIEVHDVDNDESKLLSGCACCIVETDVYDNKAALLVRADCLRNGGRGQLSFNVDDLALQSSNPAFQSFDPVDISVDFAEPNDAPIRVFSLHPLPIVAVETQCSHIYFFEIHTGTLLHTVRGMKLLQNQWQDGQGFFCCRDDNASIEWIYVNQDDLIGWIRRVLNKDMLASAVAVRTGLSGAEDLILDDMFGNYGVASGNREES